MFDYKSIVTDDELKYDFEMVVSDDLTKSYTAIDKESGAKFPNSIVLDGCTFNSYSDEIFVQFKLWQTRPERQIGKKVTLGGQNMEQLINTYEELLIASLIAVSKTKVTAEVIKKLGSALEWLRTTDFYTAPASTHYHDSFPGGLLVHCLKVYNQAIDLVKVDKFKAVPLAHATLVSLVHDWCKIGYYESFSRNVRDEYGKWESVLDYKINQKGLPLGHGVTSMFLVSRFIVLPVEIALAIRWHMGEYNVADNEVNELQKANATYPLVYLIQFADRLACTEF